MKVSLRGATARSNLQCLDCFVEFTLSSANVLVKTTFPSRLLYSTSNDHFDFFGEIYE